jgi:pimeloyl-ACP methyl ester carboxylesterase
MLGSPRIFAKSEYLRSAFPAFCMFQVTPAPASRSPMAAGRAASVHAIYRRRSGAQRPGHRDLLFDLLTPEEESNRNNVFDISLLAARLVNAVRWSLNPLPLGLFGASTGAAAAIVAAARLGGRVGAIVSRGGRADLAGDALDQGLTPTLLIVGGFDYDVIELNKYALGRNWHLARAVWRSAGLGEARSIMGLHGHQAASVWRWRWTSKPSFARRATKRLAWSWVERRLKWSAPRSRCSVPL